MNILQVKKILTSEKSRMIEQAKFTYSALGKAFEIQRKATEVEAEKQRKKIEDAAVKQTKDLETLNTDQQLKSVDYLFSKYILTKEAKDELEKT